MISNYIKTHKRIIIFILAIFILSPSFKSQAQFLTMSELKKYQNFFNQMDKNFEAKNMDSFSAYFLDTAIFVYTWRNAQYKKFQSNQTLNEFIEATSEKMSFYGKIKIDREFISAQENGDTTFAITYATYSFSHGKSVDWVRFREHYELKSGDENSNDFKVISVNSYYEKGLTSKNNFPVHRSFRYYER